MEGQEGENYWRWMNMIASASDLQYIDHTLARGGVEQRDR
jgi:hypothetical protein